MKKYCNVVVKYLEIAKIFSLKTKCIILKKNTDINLKTSIKMLVFFYWSEILFLTVKHVLVVIQDTIIAVLRICIILRYFAAIT